MPTILLRRDVLPDDSGGRRAGWALTGCAGPDDNLADHTGAEPSRVSGARRALAQALAIPGDRVVYARQVHGRDVAVVDGPRPDGAGEVDALVTTTPGLALTVLVADCVPVLLADADAGVVGVAHAGRRGMDTGVVGAALEAMRDLGAREVKALLGPSVCARCYEVPLAMREDVASRHPVAASVSWRATPALDVAAGVAEQLRRAGAATELVPGCTVEDLGLGSVRRDGQSAPRQAGLAWLEP